MVDETGRFGLRQNLAFGAQGIFGAAIGLVLAVYMGKFYLDVVLLPAGLYAVAIAAGRALDAITDPLMGHMSDHTRSRFGRRKPWILVGVLGYSAVVYLMLTPDPGLSTGGVMTWFLICYVSSFLFATMMMVPRAALAAELTFDAKERMSLFGALAVFIAVGLLLSAFMPTLLQNSGVADPRAQMAIQAGLYTVGFVLLHAILLRVVPERPEFQTQGGTPFVPGVRRAMRNRPFVITFISHVVTAIPVAIPATIMPFFVQYVLRAEAKWTGILILVYLLSGFVALPLWIFLARRFGKLPVWFINGVIAVTGGVMVAFVGEGETSKLLVIESYVGLQSQVWIFLGGAMHADVIDYDELHTGKRREAQYTALWSIIPKFAMIPGAAIPLAILGGMGYVPNEAQQTPAVVDTLRVLISVVPAGFNAIGLALMWWYPLNERVHAAVRHAVAQHARGESATDPITGHSLPPLAAREVDEDTGWFLDHFSVRELRSYVEHGRSPFLSALIKTLVSLAVVVVCVFVAVGAVDRLDVDPGPMPSLLIVLAGLSLALCAFHALRLVPARKLEGGAVSKEVVVLHLAALDGEPEQTAAPA